MDKQYKRERIKHAIGNILWGFVFGIMLALFIASAYETDTKALYEAGTYYEQRH